MLDENWRNTNAHMALKVWFPANRDTTKGSLDWDGFHLFSFCPLDRFVLPPFPNRFWVMEDWTFAFAMNSLPLIRSVCFFTFLSCHASLIEYLVLSSEVNIRDASLKYMWFSLYWRIGCNISVFAYGATCKHDSNLFLIHILSMSYLGTLPHQQCCHDSEDGWP